MKLLKKLRDQHFSPTAVGFAACFDYAKEKGHEAVSDGDVELYQGLSVVSTA